MTALLRGVIRRVVEQHRHEGLGVLFARVLFECVCCRKRFAQRLWQHALSGSAWARASQLPGINPSIVDAQPGRRVVRLREVAA
eukprot:10542504-Alexandrium_andersonii.AAC.1